VSTARPETATDAQARTPAALPTDAYRTAWEHLADELRTLDLRLVMRAGRQQRGRDGGPLDPFKGLVISHEEVADLLRDLVDGRDAGVVATEHDPGRAALRRLEDRIEARLAASACSGLQLPLPQLARLFGLTALETQALLVCLAPDLDPRYGKLFAYLQDDVTRKRPGLDLVLGLLVDEMSQALEARAVFHQQAPLVRYHLCRVADDAAVPAASRSLAVDERIVQYLLGYRPIDGRLDGLAELVAPAEATSPVIVDEGVKERILAFVRACVAPNDGQGVAIHLFGPAGSGRRGLAAIDRPATCTQR